MSTAAPSPLPLNAHWLRNSDAVLPAFSDLIVPSIAPSSWGDKAASAKRWAAYEQAVETVRLELRALGVPEAVAELASNGFMSAGFAPGFGLDDLDDRALKIRAQMALSDWTNGRVAAYRAAHAEKAAA